MARFKTSRKRALSGVVAGVGVLLLALTGCAKASPSSSDGGEQTTKEVEQGLTAGDAVGELDSIKWALYAEPPTLDYIEANTYPSQTVVSNVCESLTRLNPDLSTTPALAESIENPDPKTWVIKVRQGVKFHDGTEMTAEDVRYSLYRQIDPELGAYTGAAFENVESIEVTGDWEVTVKMSQPDYLFPKALSNQSGVVASKAAIEAAGDAWGSPTADLTCTGPYKLTSWKSGDSITLERFDDYWDDDLKPKVKTVEFDFYDDAVARANALKTGEVDGSFYITPSGTETLTDAEDGKLWYGANPTVRSLMIWNITDGPLADKRIRKALSIAIDRPTLVDSAFGGVGSGAVAPVSPDAYSYAKDTYEKAYDELPGAEPDIEEAKKLVEEAGAPTEPIKIASSTFDPSYNLTALAVQDAASKIGLKVEIETFSADEYNAMFNDADKRKGTQLFGTTWNLDMPDPLQFYAYYATPGKYNNFNDFEDAEYTKIAKQALSTEDDEERAELTVQLQDIFMDETLWIPIYNVPTTVFQSDRIAGTPTSVSYTVAPWLAYIGSAE